MKFSAWVLNGSPKRFSSCVMRNVLADLHPGEGSTTAAKLPRTHLRIVMNCQAQNQSLCAQIQYIEFLWWGSWYYPPRINTRIGSLVSFGSDQGFSASGQQDHRVGSLADGKGSKINDYYKSGWQESIDGSAKHCLACKCPTRRYKIETLCILFDNSEVFQRQLDWWHLSVCSMLVRISMFLLETMEQGYLKEYPRFDQIIVFGASIVRLCLSVWNLTLFGSGGPVGRPKSLGSAALRLSARRRTKRPPRWSRFIELLILGNSPNSSSSGKHARNIVSGTRARSGLGTGPE